MNAAASGAHQKIGKPYVVNGVRYQPAADPNYDRVGTASWYGPQFHGRKTANGETFDMNQLSAAHPTLPLPSMVRVTNLENGKQAVLRVNDRGPFAHGRIIDLSRAAASELGFISQGTAKVRVEYLQPAGMDRAILAVKSQPQSRAIAPTLASVDASKSRKRRGRGASAYFVQAAAYSDPGNASATARALRSYGTAHTSPVMRTSDGLLLHRVRVGPIADARQAATVLARVRGAGFPDARLVTND